MSMLRKLIIFLACSALAGWIVMNYAVLSSEDGRMRAIISVFFACLILVRTKRGDSEVYDSSYTAHLAVSGTAFALLGIIIPVHQLEWIGILLVVAACLRWALPKKYAVDVALALLVIYMIKPLPGSIYGNIQLVMQLLSVRGAEFLMHCLNVRVWADGFMLQTGGRVFDVPEACSGMRTAVTVLLGVIGSGILMRLSTFRIFMFSFLGLAQVLAANILRLSFMVFWSARMPSDWSVDFLHDTTGILLLAVIGLVMAEMSVFTVWRNKRDINQRAYEKGEVEGPDRASILPRFWYLFVRWVWIVLALAAAAAAVAGAVYKNRPAHKVAMMNEVIDGLFERDLDAADRAVNQALRLSPHNRNLLSKQAKVLSMRGKYPAALEKIATFEDTLSTYEKVMKSWSLMGVGKVEEASTLIGSLSPVEKDQPGVAIIMAEYAATQNNPADVIKYIRRASQSVQLMGRVRELFLYLAAHGQWRIIVECDNRAVPYVKLEHALIVIHANIKVRNMSDASEALREALISWPNEPRLLSSIYNMAVAFPGGEWEDVYEKGLTANIATLDADRLASSINDAFQLSRPDLAWISFAALREKDPTDPALFLAPVKYGDVWFSFRRHKLWIPSEYWNSVIDLADLYNATKNVEPLASMWAQVPLAEQIANDPMDRVRNSNIRGCLEQLDARQKAGTISQRMEFTYPTVLALAGRSGDAHRKLDELAVKYPERTRDINFLHVVLYDQAGQWQESYELLKRIDDGKNDVRNLPEDLMRINALMNLNMGV